MRSWSCWRHLLPSLLIGLLGVTRLLIDAAFSQVGFRDKCLYSSVAERQSCKLKVLGSIPSGSFSRLIFVPPLPPFHIPACLNYLIPRGSQGAGPPGQDTVSEWLRRWARNPLGSARRSSNPLGVALPRPFQPVTPFSLHPGTSPRTFGLDVPSQ